MRVEARLTAAVNISRRGTFDGVSGVSPVNKNKKWNAKMADRETIIETGDGGAAAIVAGMLVVALIVVGFFFFSGINRAPSGQTITLDTPKVTVNVTPKAP